MPLPRLPGGVGRRVQLCRDRAANAFKFTSGVPRYPFTASTRHGAPQARFLRRARITIDGRRKSQRHIALCRNQRCESERVITRFRQIPCVRESCMAHKPIVILEAPSILGLFPKGVETLPDALLAAGLAEQLGAQRAGRVEPPAYIPERDPETLLLNPVA